MSYFIAKNKYSLNPIKEEDLSTLQHHRNDMKTWIGLSYILPLYKIQQEKWLTNIQDDSSKLYFMISYENINIGIARIDEIDYINSNARVGCDVFINYRGNGHGQKIMETINEFGFNFLNLNRLWLLVAKYNKVAFNIYKNEGFIIEGTQQQALYRHGIYYDYIMMSRLKENYNE